METPTVYVKVSVINDGYPKKAENALMTNVGLRDYQSESFWQFIDNKWHIDNDVEWWLKEVELPSQEELIKTFGKKIQTPISLAIWTAVEYMFNKLKKK